MAIVFNDIRPVTVPTVTTERHVAALFLNKLPVFKRNKISYSLPIRNERETDIYLCSRYIFFALTKT